jgi:ABC-type transport system involved in multi-copper enzyme maturation permease subunit
MQPYQVFKHPEHGLKAVRRGFSWLGFLLTGFWALWSGLWMMGAALLVVEAVLWLFVLPLFRAEPLFPFGIGLFISWIVGANGNAWRSRSLQDRGYVLLGTLNAHNAKDAAAKVSATGGVIPPGLKAAPKPPGWFAVPSSLRGIVAIARLTWKAAFRYRLFWVIVALLLAAVVGLPLMIKDDGTAQGLTQIVITYTLGSVIALLGLCTLWLACGTLARDVEDCQMQVVAVKPISRWQIWFGKWLGLVTLNAALLAVGGVSIYGLLEWRATKLPPDQLSKLRNEVLVARGSAHESDLEHNIQLEVNQRFEEQVKKTKLSDTEARALHEQIDARVRAEVQVVPPGQVRMPPWIIELGSATAGRLRGRPLFLRVKFNSAQGSAETYYAQWAVGNPQKRTPWQSEVMSLSPDTFHEFQIPSDLYDENGQLVILFQNPNETALLFPLNEGMEVLYRQGGFGFNFCRGLGIILCWMALLAALGLAAASFLSFPVAAFVSLAILTMGLSTGTMSNVVEEGTVLGADPETGAVNGATVDHVMVPFFRGMLYVINIARQFSPIDSLSTGRDISWGQLGLAAAQIVLLLGGIFAIFGTYAFHRRELATAQSAH